MTDSIDELERSERKIRLLELFEKLPDRRQKEVLDLLERWHRDDRRRFPRKACMLPVDYSDEGRAFRDFITNISLGGVFLETPTAFAFGTTITLAFSSPSYDHPVKLLGMIVRNERQGLGIRFTATNQHLDPMIASL